MAGENLGDYPINRQGKRRHTDKGFHGCTAPPLDRVPRKAAIVTRDVKRITARAVFVSQVRAILARSLVSITALIS